MQDTHEHLERVLNALARRHTVRPGETAEQFVARCSAFGDAEAHRLIEDGALKVEKPAA